MMHEPTAAIIGDIPYVGRFAPSPTGPLHMGSLLLAIASYLDARANKGRWIVRMEDLDPAREPAGAAHEILSQLQQFGLNWDGEVLLQSTRLASYAALLEQLQKSDLCYACSCSRPQIRAMGAVYDGRCRLLKSPPSREYAIRVKTESLVLDFEDGIQGKQQENIAKQSGDFIIRRKDGLFAYQMAVVIDDAFQGITHIIRGYDLLDSTPRQIYLQRLFGFSSPTYSHVPVIVDEQGQKLSKQRFAPAIDGSQALQLTNTALQMLGQAPPPSSEFADNAAQLHWAISNWDIQAVPKLATIAQATQL